MMQRGQGEIGCSSGSFFLGGGYGKASRVVC
jgi:hypothetical protein